jgi:hypothetical protein
MSGNFVGCGLLAETAETAQLLHRSRLVSLTKIKATPDED